MEAEASRLVESIESGEAAKSPDLLNRFVLLTFAGKWSSVTFTFKSH